MLRRAWCAPQGPQGGAKPLSDPFYPGLIESNEVLTAEEKELTEKTMSFAMQVTAC